MVESNEKSDDDEDDDNQRDEDGVIQIVINDGTTDADPSVVPPPSSVIERDKDSAIPIVINDGRGDEEPRAVPPPGSTSDEAHVAVVDCRGNQNHGTEEIAASEAIEDGVGEDDNSIEENIHAEEEHSPTNRETAPSTGIESNGEENAASFGDDDVPTNQHQRLFWQVEPGAYRIYPSNPAPRQPPDNPRNTGNATAEAELAELLGIPMVEAEPVDPVDHFEPEEEVGADSEFATVAVAQHSPPNPNSGETSHSSCQGGGGEGNADVIEARSIPTITVCGRTVKRSTAGFVGILVMMIVAVAAMVVSLATNSNNSEDVPKGAEENVPVQIEASEARKQRREVLVGILSPSISQYGAFNGTVSEPNATSSANHRVEALEWLVDDFPTTVSTATEMLDYYPEWKMRQRYILALLYFATGGPDWYAQLRFLSSANECSWSGDIPRLQGHEGHVFTEDGSPYNEEKELVHSGGVGCDKVGRVDTISLGLNNLRGSIPHEISGLRESLVKLGLMRNEISSTIPSSLSELKNLQLLNLVENCLSGVVPEGLSGLSMLEFANFFGSNDLRGSLNGFCNGTRYREKYSKNIRIIADCGDCPGSRTLVECTCCQCCDYNTMSCCYKGGVLQKGKQYAWETFNRGECALNGVQLAWKEENCPCFVQKKNSPAFGKFACSTDCPV